MQWNRNALEAGAKYKAEEEEEEEDVELKHKKRRLINDVVDRYADEDDSASITVF